MLPKSAVVGLCLELVVVADGVPVLEFAPDGGVGLTISAFVAAC